MEIRTARAIEASTLTAIAQAAKAHWGYPAAWLARWQPVLTLNPAFIAEHEVYVGVEGEELVGFYALGEGAESGQMELEHMWVKPQWMGRGVGRTLFEHAAKTARALGATVLLIEADPHAAGFYERMGAHLIGERSYMMEAKARVLPLLALALITAPDPGH